MRIKIRHILPLVGVLFMSAGLAACAKTQTPDDSNILFSDDFSRVSSGWDRVKHESGITNYQDGHYQIQVNQSNYDLWANPGLMLEDTQIEVDAVKQGGVDDNDYGLICRYQNPEHFYFGIVSSDGYYAIGKMVEGEQILLTGAELQITGRVRGGESLNHLRFDCVGWTLSLYANSALLAEVNDPDFLHGDVGLIAGTFNEPGADIAFDNFVVFKP